MIDYNGANIDLESRQEKSNPGFCRVAIGIRKQERMLETVHFSAQLSVIAGCAFSGLCLVLFKVE